MTEAGRDLDAEVAEKVMTHPHANWRDPVPKYSTDIAAAWAVVEKLIGNPMRWLFVAESPLIAGDTWLAWFRNAYGDQNHKGRADTLSEAICRAALAAMRLQQDVAELQR